MGFTKLIGVFGYVTGSAEIKMAIAFNSGGHTDLTIEHNPGEAPRRIEIDIPSDARTVWISLHAGAETVPGFADAYFARGAQPVQFSISTSVSPSNGGTVTGGGTFQSGASVTLNATPNTGYTFDGWYEGSTRVSTNSIYTFSATADRALEARFALTPTKPAVPNPHNSWATEELQSAFELGLVPDSLLDASVDLRLPITRAEFAGVAVKTYELLANTTALPALTNPFTDTQDVDALKAFNAGIMVGYSDTEFQPDTVLNREQAATALTRVFKRSTMPGWTFKTDADFPLTFSTPQQFVDDGIISGWARESVYFMAANGIINGFEDRTFRPHATTDAQEASGYANATREQALLIALRMIEKLGK
jgi:uncharacterized repeat protein (TIGR02543 family)